MSAPSQAWYLQERGKAHKRVTETISQIRSQQSSYRSDVRHYKNLYYNHQVTAAGGNYYLEYGNLRFNLIQAVVDTAASILLANKPVPTWQTTAGDWKTQRSAKIKSQVVTGQFYQLGVHELARKVVYDGLIGGTGYLYGYVNSEGVPTIEHLNQLQVIVDHDEGLWASPRSIGLVRPVAREVLQALYPRKRTPLEKSSGPSNDDFTDFGLRRDARTYDAVLVHEVWHLPSIPGYDDGRHVMCTSNTTLVDEPWDPSSFPIAKYAGWHDRPGWHGMGLAERVRSDQERVNDLLTHIKALQDLGSNTLVFGDVGPSANGQSNIPNITNLPLQFVPYVGSPPTIVTTDAVPPGLLSAVDDIVQRVLMREGISESAAGGEKPEGTSGSAVALRAADDLGSRRLVLPIGLLETFYLDVARLIVQLNDQAAKENRSHEASAKVRRGSSSFIKLVKWRELDIDPNDVRVNLFPMSSVPTSPAGRWAAYDEMTQKGWVDLGFARELYGMPDVDAFNNLQNADLDLCMSDLEDVLDGEQKYPDPLQNPQQAAQTALNYYFVAKQNQADEAVLKNLRAYAATAKGFMKAAQAAMQPATPTGQPQQ